MMTRVRREADQENSTFIADAELREYLNAGIAELHDLLIKAEPEFFMREQTLTGDGSSDDFAVPTDYYGTVGIDYQTDSTNELYVGLRRLSGDERNTYGGITGPALGYRFMYNNTNPELPYVRLQPRPTNGEVYRHTYIISATKYATNGDDDTDTVYGINGYEEYPILRAVLKCFAKEESAPAVVREQLYDMRQRLEVAAENRAFQPSSVTDVTSGGYADPADYWALRPFR